MKAVTVPSRCGSSVSEGRQGSSTDSWSLSSRWRCSAGGYLLGVNLDAVFDEFTDGLATPAPAPPPAPGPPARAQRVLRGLRRGSSRRGGPYSGG